MGCPRCGGAVEEFTLENSRSTYCESCGWVGIDVELSPGESSPSDDFSTNAMEVGREPSADRGRTGASTAPGSEPPAESDANHVGIPPETLTLLGIDADDADHLDEVGITSVEELAAADPDDLAEDVDVDPEDLRLWIRRASILVVTDDGE